MGFTVKKGSEKGVSRRCLERPLREYAPLGVRPIRSLHTKAYMFRARPIDSPIGELQEEWHLLATDHSTNQKRTMLDKRTKPTESTAATIVNNNCDRTPPIQNTKPLRTPKYIPKYTPHPPPKPKCRQKRKNVRNWLAFVYFELWFWNGIWGVFPGVFWDSEGYVFCVLYGGCMIATTTTTATTTATTTTKTIKC